MTAAPRQSLSVEEYTAELLHLVRPDERTVAVRLAEALGRVVAAPISSQVNIPAFTNIVDDRDVLVAQFRRQTRFAEK